MLVAAAIVALFTVPVKQGESLLSWQALRTNWHQPQRLLEQPTRLLNGQAHPATVYRWRDGAGNWQYGQTPPAGVEAEVMTVRQSNAISSEKMRGDVGHNEEKQQ